MSEYYYFGSVEPVFKSDEDKSVWYNTLEALTDIEKFNVEYEKLRMGSYRSPPLHQPESAFGSVVRNSSLSPPTNYNEYYQSLIMNNKPEQISYFHNASSPPQSYPSIVAHDNDKKRKRADVNIAPSDLRPPFDPLDDESSEKEAARMIEDQILEYIGATVDVEGKKLTLKLLKEYVEKTETPIKLSRTKADSFKAFYSEIICQNQPKRRRINK
eukprot:TRINITY_DN26400_c0_g1_i1.p1 TRINITY_DN26400_c0_g1~~TRINITY_DN26400_c0_g1_i1.p1  ORF type:complete len:214 (-),score=36.32 TRINITY_DN26400_c0_g1_i1:41-682(-)